MLAPGQAGADLLTYGFRIDPTDVPFTGSDTVEQFAPSLGALESVEITYKTTITADWSITNSGGHSASGTYESSVDIALTTAGNLVDQSNDQTTGSIPFTVGPHHTTTFNSSKHGTSDVTYTSGSILSQFTGAGLITLSVSPTVTNTLTGSVTSTTPTVTADATGSVIYTYAVVPEPSSLVIVAMGALGVLAHGAHRRYKADKP